MGGVDEITARECEWVLGAPEPAPDYVYHEVNLDNAMRLHEDGCVSYRVLSPWESYEQEKLNARRRAAEGFADEIDNLWKVVQGTTVGVEPELLNDLSFSIDEKGTIRPMSASRPLDAETEKLLFERLNNHSEFKEAAKEYVWLLAGLMGRTIDGLSAPYARHFVGSGSQEG
jgi:hypothetical protein